VTLRSQRKRFTADGGHRTVPPDHTVATYEHHISPITGAVRHLSRVSVDEDHFLHVYVAGQNVAMHRDSGLSFLRHGLRSKSGGKGTTDAQARASALCEALERYSGNFQGDEIRKLASYRQLGARATHPNACMIVSDAQYERRQEWNAQASRFHRIPDPLDEEVEIEWTPVWSLTDEAFTYLPTSYCYYGYPAPREASYCWADSNGSAAGNTVEEAILHGFLELVERDSVCLWWYNRVQRPRVDLESFDEPYVHRLLEHYRKLNRQLWVLDLTSDLDISTFAAISRRTDSVEEDIILGFGAHFEPRLALLRALTELNQYFPLLTLGNENDKYEYANAEHRHWWKTATLENQPHLAPDPSMPATPAEGEVTWSDDLREDVLRCQQIVARQGLEMLVLDQTRPDIGLPVVKVIVPGLRHFWVRLGPGRLYDAPVKLGWLEEPLAEDQLNPIPMFV
jgi:ribosomal protein S12 methylthiotransferase accessory factor